MSAKTKKILMWVFILVLLTVAAYWGWNQWKKKSSVKPEASATPQAVLQASPIGGAGIPVVTNVQTVQPKSGSIIYKKSNNAVIGSKPNVGNGATKPNVGNGVVQASGL